MGINIAELWDDLERAGDEGLEVYFGEMVGLIAYANEQLAPGDGLKIERAGSNEWFIAIW